MKLKYTFEQLELDGQIMAVPVGDNAGDLHAMLRLNDSAAEILNLLKEETTEEAICSALMEKYEGNPDEIAAFVHDYIEQLKDAGIINE